MADCSQSHTSTIFDCIRLYTNLRSEFNCFLDCFLFSGGLLFIPAGTNVPTRWPLKNAVDKKAVDEICDKNYHKNEGGNSPPDLFFLT